MSLSSQATNKPTNSNANHAAIKWNDFAAKEFEEHSKSRTRHRNHIPQRYQQQQRQQQPTPYSPPLHPSPRLVLSPPTITTTTTIPSTSTDTTFTPSNQKQSAPSQQQKSINDSTRSWQNFARQKSKASPNNNNDNGVVQLHNISTPFQSQNNTYSAAPKKSVSENVRRDRYHYDNNNNNNTHNSNNNNSYYYNNKAAPITAKMTASTVSSYPSSPSSRTNMSTSSIPTRRFQHTLNDPPLCFCKKLACERKISHEGIIIYECHYLQDIIGDKNQLPSTFSSSLSSSSISTAITDKSICAFHVHKNFWDTCRQNLRDGKPIDKLDPSLVSCPEFNFTFSIVLPQQRNNTFMKCIHYTPPNCFCNRPARLFDNSIRYHQKRPFFACKELDASDAPIRCGFFTFIENARFKPSEYLTHTTFERLERVERIPPAPSSSSSSSSPTVSFSSTSDHSSYSQQQQQQQQQQRYRRYQHYNNNNNNSDWPPSPHESVCSTTTATSFRINPEEDETIYNPQQQQTPDHLEMLLKASSSSNRKSINQPFSIETNDDNNNNGELGESGSRGEKGGMENNDDNTMTANNAHFIQLLHGAKISSFLRGTTSTHDNNNNENEHSAALLSYIIQGTDDDLLTKRNDSPFSSGSSYNGIGSTTASSYGSLIPSAVYTRHAINKKTAMDAQTLLEESKIRELRHEIQELEESIFQLKQEIDEQREINQKKQYELSKLKMEQEERRKEGELLIRKAEELMAEKEDIVNSMDEIRHILKEEIEIREKSQRRQNELEEMTKEVVHINEILSHEMAEKEDKLNMKDLKCRVCFQENIEYALVPCYHCSYCKTCAEKLTECAICREAKYTIQKIYIS